MRVVTRLIPLLRRSLPLFALLTCSTIGHAQASHEALWPIDVAISKGVINTRVSIFSQSDQQHVLSMVETLKPGLIYKTFTAVFGETRQQDLDAAGKLAMELRRIVPRAILGGGLYESIQRDSAPQTLSCGGGMQPRTFAPDSLIDKSQKTLNGTSWLDMSLPASHDYYVCIGTMLIDRGYTLLHFEQHENVIKHASNQPEAVRNYVDVMNRLRRYGSSKGLSIYFSGDPATDATAHQIDFFYVPSRFFHTTFDQRYQNKIAHPGVGVGYSYGLSPLKVRDVLRTMPKGAKVFFYIDNWDWHEDDLRRFMELDAENRRLMLISSARTAKQNGAYFILNLLHCLGCVPPEVVGDLCELSGPSGKSEYDAAICHDLPAIKIALQVQQ